ncbi:MAG: hypothetical protein WBP15_05545 [Tabrizicola sp.]
MLEVKNLAFVASTWASSEMKKLRYDLHLMGKERSRTIWVAEFSAPELRQENGFNQLEIADRCLEEIDHSEYFIMLLDGGIGSHVSVLNRESASTFIELELFHAVMREKAIHLIVIGNLSDGALDRRLLDLVSFGVRCDVTEVQSHGAALDTISRILARPRRLAVLRPRGTKQFLSGHLAVARHGDFTNQCMFQEIEFLRGQPYIVAEVGPDLELVRSLLDDARNQAHSTQQMSRTWLALRSLMQLHYRDSRDARALGLWEEALRIWANFSAWRGHHAHLWLGHIAALGSLKSVIERQGRPLTEVVGAEHSENLSGALASAYYSLSKIAPKNLSRSFLDRGTLYLKHGLATVEEGHLSNLYAALGSHDLLRRRIGAAVQHYRRAIELAERFHHSDQRMGELLAELGWAEVHQGARSVGRKRISEGVSLMVASGASPGFVARGLRKQAAAEILTFHVGRAYATTRKASAIVEEHGLFDQRDILIRTSDRIHGVLTRVTGGKRSK